MHTKSRLGILLAVLGFASFSCGDALAKWLSSDYSTVQIVWTTALISALLFLCFSPWLGGIRNTVQTQQKFLHLMRVILNCMLALLVFYSLARISLAQFYPIIFCAPFLSAILAMFVCKEKIGLHRWGAIILGFCGVLIAVRPGVAPFDWAILTAFCATFCFAGVYILVRKMGEAETPLSLVLFPFLFNTIILSPFALINFVVPSLEDMILFCIAGCFFAGGLLMVSSAFRIAPASICAPFHYTQIIWGVVLGILIFGDYPDLGIILGSIVIIASGLYLVYRESLAHKNQAKQGGMRLKHNTEV